MVPGNRVALYAFSVSVTARIKMWAFFPNIFPAPPNGFLCGTVFVDRRTSRGQETGTNHHQLGEGSYTMVKKVLVS